MKQLEDLISNRLRWISLLAILCVVLGHCVRGDGPIQHFIMAVFAQWHVPCFYMISGALLAKSLGNSSCGRILLKKSKSLCIPYLSWCLIGLVTTLRFPDPWYDVNGIFGILTQFPSGNANLWYLHSLIVFMGVAILLWNLVQKMPSSVCCICFVSFYVTVFALFEWFGLVTLYGTPTSPFYFLLGYLTGGKAFKMAKPTYCTVMLWGASAVILRLIWFSDCYGGFEQIFRAGCVLSMIGTVWLGLGLLPPPPLPNVLTPIFFVYCVHGLILYWINLGLDRFGAYISLSNIVGTFLAWGLVSYLSFFVAKWTRSKSPVIFGIISGGR